MLTLGPEEFFRTAIANVIIITHRVVAVPENSLKRLCDFSFAHRRVRIIEFELVLATLVGCYFFHAATVVVDHPFHAGVHSIVATAVIHQFVSLSDQVVVVFSRFADHELTGRRRTVLQILVNDSFGSLVRFSVVPRSRCSTIDIIYILSVKRFDAKVVLV